MRDDWNSAEVLAFERACLARVRRGDLEAFGTLYDRFAPRLHARVLLPRLGRTDLAEEALAETFRRAFEKLEGYRHEGTSLYFWLARIAKNVAEDAHRSRARTSRALLRFEAMIPELVEPPQTPEALLASHEEDAKLRARVAEVLGGVAPRYRRAIELRFFEARSREECAAALDVRLGTFDVLVLRALRAFRTAWEASAPGDEGDVRG